MREEARVRYLASATTSTLLGSSSIFGIAWSIKVAWLISVVAWSIRVIILTHDLAAVLPSARVRGAAVGSVSHAGADEQHHRGQQRYKDLHFLCDHFHNLLSRLATWAHSSKRS